MGKTATLAEAIDQQITLGQRDPAKIGRKLEELHGRSWLVEQLSSYADELVAEIARRRLGAIRRSRELALRPGDEKATAELNISTSWVPGEGWKRSADLTVSDLRAKADWYRNFASASFRRAAWCDDVADSMEHEKVATLGELKALLPSLPEHGELVA